MFKRILTVTLAAILTLETPMTAYAAQTVPVQIDESVEETDISAENDEITGGGGKRKFVRGRRHPSCGGRRTRAAGGACG